MAPLPHPFTASIKYPELTCNSEFYRFRSTDFIRCIFANITPLRLICGLISPPCRRLGYFSCGLLLFFGARNARTRNYISLTPRKALLSLYYYLAKCWRQHTNKKVLRARAGPSVTRDKGRCTEIPPLQCISISSESKKFAFHLWSCAVTTIDWTMHYLNITLAFSLQYNKTNLNISEAINMFKYKIAATARWIIVALWSKVLFAKKQPMVKFLVSPTL